MLFVSSDLAQLNYKAKQIKMDIDDVIMSEPTIPSLDPFNVLHEHVHELILQHGIGLTCSEVSKNWAKMIAGSKKAMINIQLNVTAGRGRPPTSHEIQSIINSDRNYLRMSFECRHSETFLDCCLLLIKNKETLVELTVGKILFPDKNIWGAHLFPKLKTLIISHGKCKNLVTHLLRTSKKIERLVEKEKVEDIPGKFGRELVDFFQLENEALKHLEVRENLFIYLDERDISGAVKIKLESLRFDDYITWDPMVNLKKFVSSQAGSLKSLSLSSYFHHLMKTIIEDLSALEDLTIDDVQDFDPAQIPQYIRPNISIKELKMKSFTIPFLIFLLVAMPNVKIMRLSWATNTELKVIATTGRHLEKVYLTHDRDSSEAFYNFLKLQNEEINRNIQFIQA